MKTAQELINDFIPEVREKLQKLLDEGKIQNIHLSNHKDLIIHCFWTVNEDHHFLREIISVGTNNCLIKPDPLPEVYKIEEGERKYSIDEIEEEIKKLKRYEAVSACGDYHCAVIEEENDGELLKYDDIIKLIENLKSK